MVENKMVNSKPEKSSLSATDAAAMKYVSFSIRNCPLDSVIL